ncbi:MAG: biotin--[acetyl-CoA-carboxylase] ligase [Rhodocyclaceae bacterium]|nr:biotin--[acetyl-CoA-carboxylase] ligase [Rhodocyclaceae bacterium]
MPAKDRLDTSVIDAALGARVSRFGLQVLEACESTNTCLRDAPPPDDGRIHVVACESQTAGRGRRGRTWVSRPGESLTFSMLWRFAAGAPVPAGLSLVAGVALARCLERLGVDGVQLKWPNDVLVLGRKLAGILVELVPGRGRTPAAVIGIGINVGSLDRDALPAGVDACALADVMAQVPSRSALLAALLADFDDLLGTYEATGFPALRQAWEQRNAHAGLPVEISGEAREIVGTCLGVDADGALRIATDAGETRVLAGEVSLRPVA